ACVVSPDIIQPDWPAPPSVRALATTRAMGDIKTEEARGKLARHLPASPAWHKQEHGIKTVDASQPRTIADASYSRKPGVVCAVMIADCMPVLLADEKGEG